MKAFDILFRLNRFRVFQPSRWPYAELISRGAALSVIAALIGLKIYQFNRFPQSFGHAKRFYRALTATDGSLLFSELDIIFIWGIRFLVWLVETAILAGYVSAYLSRVNPVKIADGFMETYFPIGVAGIPVLIGMAPAIHFMGLTYSSPGYLPFYLMVMSLIALGGWINLVGLLTLRRSFTIMTEARELVNRGIYRYVRHPLYLGHFIMFFAGLLLRWHWYTIAMYIIFFIGQVIRSKREEKKLMEAFGDYADYRRRTGMFFPRFRGLIKGEI
jgi:protein-S-isoprenylcysteine O-methyltransferase Ste14